MCGLLGYQGNVNELPDFKNVFDEIKHRGPDDTEIVVSKNGDASLCFHRLAIMDPTAKGHQPFQDDRNGNIIICNGEIYNFVELRKQYEATYKFKSHSDCEVLVPMLTDMSLDRLCQSLDAEFAFVMWDEKNKKLLAARDPIGIRPLFYGKTKKGKYIFASEVKTILPYCEKVENFPPGHYFDGKKIKSYIDLTTVKKYHEDDEKQILKNIREKLIEGVRKRLVADVPVGFLLSGGLDSSLVCAIASKILKKPLQTFAVGLDHAPIDLRYAKIVADFIKSKHHEVIFDKKETLGVLNEVIHHLETWDITTIRASIGMYIVCRYVHKNTVIKVLLTGEISDELFGYKYTDFAPSPEEFQLESKKRIDELYMYDVLRADRSISAHALEARVPFGDLDFVKYVMGIDPKYKMNTTGMGKNLLRQAFAGLDYLPEEILWREKAAFSDAVGHSMVDYLKEYAAQVISDKEFAEAKKKYPQKTPFTKESYLYRKIFESHFPGQVHLIKDFWMPNQTWPNCKVQDPSARVLSNYGKSGL
ncbi:MAG: asparagine synthase B [Bacteriovoracaceae bacterium]|nr:asparagine synthase B [Bacteriovoracaceae bacterium]